MFYIIASFLFKWTYRLLSHHRVEWECDLRGLLGPAIIAPNHVSYLDPQLVSGSWSGELHFFAREELFHNKILGILLRGLHTHPVVKGKELATIRLAMELLRDGKKIVLFPEGTRSSDGEMGPLRSGVAFLSRQMECPVIPCFIEGSYEAWPKDQRFPRFIGSRTVCRFGHPLWPKDEHGTLLSKEQINEAIQGELTRLSGSTHA